jgi:alkanesulfonate monooxygenase SsuD/methylene tetrahydromethanopterin reductase-like flavin-dependent oxidoreductase (luciferase family)
MAQPHASLELPAMRESAWSCHPWVAQRRGRLSFALQAVAGMPTNDPGRQLIRLGTLAEALGYDAFFLGDHPAVAPECWLHLTAIACGTKRISLGPMVTAVPYRPPLLTARLASDLDRLSRGRLVLGLGIGWNRAAYGLGANEFAQLGLPYGSVAERQAALEEAIQLMRTVWTAADSVSFAGAAYRAEDAPPMPPVQTSGPPTVIAGSGDRTLRQVARFADVCNFGGGPAGKVNTPAQARERLAVLRAQCRTIGRPYEDILKTHFTHWIILAPDEERAAAKVRRYFSDGIEPFWQDLLVWGTPQSVARHFLEFADAGIDYFILQTVDPNDEETIRLAAEALGPLLLNAAQ